MQWISEVMHFCAGLPIILVGCKKDLRRDPRVIEELRKTNQRPVTPEEVCSIRFLGFAPATLGPAPRTTTQILPSSAAHYLSAKPVIRPYPHQCARALLSPHLPAASRLLIYIFSPSGYGGCTEDWCQALPGVLS